MINIPFRIKFSGLIGYSLVILLSSQLYFGWNSSTSEYIKIFEEKHDQTLRLNQYGNPGGDLLHCSDPNRPNKRREGIISLDNPKFISISQADDYLDDDELILGFEIEGVIRAYPHKIIREHEVVNDNYGGSSFSITYCPLTGSGIIYDTNQLNNSELGVTGYLYESNLVFYDRTSDTCFSQMLNYGLSGVRRGQILNYEPIVETNWASWKLLYPESQILSLDTGFPEGRYETNFYASYETSSSIFYPSNFHQDVLPYNLFHPKEKTIVLQHEGETFLFPFEELAKFPVSTHIVGDKEIVIIYDQERNIAIPYQTTLDEDTQIHFENTKTVTLDDNGFPTMKDTTYSIWNILGEAISVQFSGLSLKQYPAYQAYWFAASIFYPDASIFVNNSYVQYDQSFSGGHVYEAESDISKAIFFIILVLSLPVATFVIFRLKRSKKIF